jgi:hypothetical protein
MYLYYSTLYQKEQKLSNIILIDGVRVCVRHCVGWRFFIDIYKIERLCYHIDVTKPLFFVPINCALHPQDWGGRWLERIGGQRQARPLRSASDFIPLTTIADCPVHPLYGERHDSRIP